jgi:hypothetical protein
LLLTALTLGKNHPNAWTDEEHNILIDLMKDIDWGSAPARDVWSIFLPNRKIGAITARFALMKRWGWV